MRAESRYIIGIAGGSCAGKTWLADRILKALGENAARVSQDDFYLDRSYLPPARRARLNFDHPRSVDWDLLEGVLENFAEGQIASVPRYDFATHGRLSGDAKLHPAAVLLVEGLWLFRQSRIRNWFDFKIFIRSSSELCTERRLQRDTMERGRTRDQVLEQLTRYTLPMSERFVAPQEKWADLVLHAPVREEEILTIVNKVKTHNALVIGI